MDKFSMNNSPRTNIMQSTGIRIKVSCGVKINRVYSAKSRALFVKDFMLTNKHVKRKEISSIEYYHDPWHALLHIWQYRE